MALNADATWQRDAGKVIGLSPRLGALIKLSPVRGTDSGRWRQTAAAPDPHSLDFFFFVRPFTVTESREFRLFFFFFLVFPRTILSGNTRHAARRKYVHSCERVCKCQVHKEMRPFLHVCWNWFISHSNKICLMSYET